MLCMVLTEGESGGVACGGMAPPHCSQHVHSEGVIGEGTEGGESDGRFLSIYCLSIKDHSSALNNHLSSNPLLRPTRLVCPVKGKCGL